jgi:starch synthase (maltosyl-transferring)
VIEMPNEGRVRVVIESLSPQIDDGRFSAKRIVGDLVRIEADCFADGHDALGVVLQWKRAGESSWKELPMEALGNDRWCARLELDSLGDYYYRVSAWVDHFLSWQRDLARREEPEDIRIAALYGAQLIDDIAARATGVDASSLRDWAQQLRAQPATLALQTIGLDQHLGAVAQRYPDRSLACETAPLCLRAERERARFSAWYECFPRSLGRAGTHGNLKDLQARLPHIARMGFDVLYLPPIHPIGRVNRKGKNNTLHAFDDDVGSPWAIGADEGGHKAIHPALGNLEDFQALVNSAREQRMEIALDIAFQCAPDHPYVKTHPEWFRHRPDGSIQYAENPPKQYQDIYPFDFESSDWQGLWRELFSIFEFWIEQGVQIFRVDNPHTKSFAFWEWCIKGLQAEHPEVLFLAEAFTRPRVMHRLAKLGFTQSYTYFTWRNTKRELSEYFTELTQGPGRDYFRPNVWPTTPDILPEYLQYGGRAAFIARAALAATLSSNYGIYGPAFEYMEHEARESGSEEFLHSEKYQLRDWPAERSDSLAPLLARLNAIRRENPALQDNSSLRFLVVDNENLIVYSKHSAGGANIIITVVNLDPYHAQSGWVQLDMQVLGMAADTSFQMHELLGGARYLWQGARNYVRLDPAHAPAHIFRLRRRVRKEQDFDYFL